MEEHYYAHSKEREPPENWHRLEDHLKSVAEMARNFANDFGAGDWAYLAGLWHDLGKYSKEFQDKIRKDIDAHIEGVSNKVDHSTAGAQHAVSTINVLGHLLGYVIAGHHSGLLNGRDIKICQEARLSKEIHPWKHGLQSLPKFSGIETPSFLQNMLSKKDAFGIAFFIRMVFSCLIDADFLDTEAFVNPQQASFRGKWPDRTLEKMDQALTQFVSQLNPTGDPSVNRARNLVREACLKAAEKEPGLFSLTVPTGGGKTLSSLAFALRHAIKYGLRRIIYIIPLTSIIEQNADVFREAMKPVVERLGRDVILEHHSNLDPEKETTFNRLAEENWDAPLIVTTSVQFYESLFANKTSRCRKLHRLALSVIILDEAQTLPVDYLKPCLRALDELVTNYKTSIVICTATQPAIERRESFEIGLQKPFEIIPNPIELYHQLQRVFVEDIGSQSDQDLCRRIQAESQVLCIVNTRLHAKKLFEAIGKENGHFHLSGNMCPAHRTEKLKQIRGHLNNGLVCRVVSTQVVEAGVDIDFPVVYRSLAGLDSIAQAAGRCNRNGRLTQKGKTYVFRSEHTTSERFFSDTAQCAGQILTLYQDVLNLEAIQHYFQLYYWDQSQRWDEKRIMDNFSLLNDRKFPFNFAFMQTAENFQLIDETKTIPLIIPWNESGQRLCKRLRSMTAPTLEIQRELQRYVVPIPRRVWERHVGTDIHLIHENISVLISPEVHYSEETGLNLEAEEPGAIFV